MAGTTHIRMATAQLVKTTFRLSKFLLKKLKHFATDQEKSATEVFNEALRLYLSGKVWIVFNHTGDEGWDSGDNGILHIASSLPRAKAWLRGYLKTHGYGELFDKDDKPITPDEGDYHIDDFELDYDNKKDMDWFQEKTGKSESKSE